MKQSIQFKKKESAPPIKKPASGQGMARLRGLTSNHTVVGGDWEQQADAAADRVVRGEKGVAKILTPAPAAGFHLPASRGEALSSGLQHEFEEGFGADLSAVRIHRDETARTNVQMHGARAFTSGSHVFLSGQASDLESESGQHLLAHEIAHVLQQTGRMSAEGNLTAVNASGGGALQFQIPGADPFGEDKVAFLSSGTDALTALADRHGKRPDADDSLTNLIEWVKQQSGGSLPQRQSSPFGDSLITIATDKSFKPIGKDTPVILTPQSMGFLIDCLKVGGRKEDFEAAGKLLDGDTQFEIKSAFGPRTAFRDFLNKTYGEDWVAGAFAYKPLKLLWPGVFLNIFAQYVLNPGRVPQVLYGFQELQKKELGNIDATQDSLIASDRVIMAFPVMEKYDTIRYKVMLDLDTQLLQKQIKKDVAAERRVAAMVMAEGLSAVQAKAETQTWADMLGKMQAIAQAAADFWGKVSALKTGLQESVKLTTANIGTLIPDIKRLFAADDPLYAPLHQLLKSAIQPDGLFFLDVARKATAVPSPEEYEKRSNTLADNLGLRKHPDKNFMLQLEQKLISLQTQGQLESEEAQAVGFVIWWLLDLQPILLDYSAAKDPDAKKGFTDNRLWHRLKVAREFAWFSQIAGWDDMLPAISDIFQGKDVGKSSLVSKDSWMLQSEISLEEMETDFPGTSPVSDEYGFTGPQLTLFFHTLMAKGLREAVDDAVDATQQDPKVKLNADLVNQKVAKLPRPWRVVPPPTFQMILNPDEMAPINDKTPNPNLPNTVKLLKESPKIMADFVRLAREKQLGADPQFIARKESVEMFAWIIPNVNQLAVYLSGVDLFKDLMAKAGYTGPVDAKWMQKLLELYGNNQAKLNEDIFAALKDYAKQQHVELETALRNFTALNRRLVAEALAKRLLAYAKNHSVAGGGAANFLVPKQLFDTVIKFSIAAQPALDSPLQTALLLLSLGDELTAAFPDVDAAAQVPPILHYFIVQAVKFADEDAALALKGTNKAQAQAIHDLLYVNPYDSTQNEHLADFVKHRDQLNDLGQHMEEARKQMQESFGFASDDGVTLKSLSFYPRIKPGRRNAFELGGDEWELVQVHRKFIYHPEMSETASTSQAAQPILKDGAGNKVDIQHRILANFLVNGVEYDVYEDDREKMKALSQAVFDQTLSIQMENLAEGLETFAMVMVDVVELVPGVGQEVMEARMTAQTAMFLGVELPKIVEAVRKDPIGYIQDLGKKLIDKYLTWEGVITFLILGQGLAPFESERKPVAAKQDVKPTGKLARVINVLRKLGMRLAEAVNWLQLRIAGPIRSLQSSIATRPKLGWILRKAMEGAAWIANMVPPDLKERLGGTDQGVAKKDLTETALGDFAPSSEELPANPTPEQIKEKREKESKAGNSWIDLVKADIQESGEDFKKQFGEKLEILREAQLPSEVIPLSSLAGFVMDFFLSKLGAKVRIARAILQYTEPYKQVHKAIADVLGDEIRDTALDPNKYWREYILDKVEDQFVGARNKLVEVIYNLTDKIADATGVEALRLPRPEDKKKEDFGIERQPYPSDEVETAPKVGMVPKTGSLVQLPTTPGQPLAAQVRLKEERRFGHDFKHVRLHTGEENRSALEDLGANAATSGSHIFLRPGLDPQQGFGAQVLRHELTHTLQQTGPRPLGKQHTERPLRGQVGKGVTYDTLREAAADVMAKADQAVAPEPMSVDAGAEGIQPSLEDAAIHVLEMFTEFGKIENYEKKTGTQAVPGMETAQKVWAAVKKRVSEQKESDREPFVTSVIQHIAKRVEDTNLTVDLPKVAELAQKPEKGARGKKPKTELDFERFVTLLEALIFGRTGVVMQLKLKAGPPIAVDSLKITYVHLGFIEPGPKGKSPLWDAVMTNTPEISSGDDADKVRYEVHARLKILGPDPFIWKTGGKDFKFSPDFVDAFKKVRATRKPELEKMPTKTEYLNPKGPNESIGLRVGLHYANKQKQKGPDRESHHTTQYLLLQFFRNDNTVPAWESGTTYPGIFPAKGKRRMSFASSAGSLDLDKLDPDASLRGSGMPAILVAADTHRRGKLHIEKEGKWDGPEGDPDGSDSQGRVTQGFTISAEFKKQLFKTMKVYDSSPTWEAEVAKNPSKAADNIYSAIIGTYKWMRGVMLPALENGLKTREVAYYRGLVARNHLQDPKTGEVDKNYRMEESDMDAVISVARTNNDDEMAKAGFK